MNIYIEMDGELVLQESSNYGMDEVPHAWDENGKCATPWCGCED